MIHEAREGRPKIVASEGVYPHNAAARYSRTEFGASQIAISGATVPQRMPASAAGQVQCGRSQPDVSSTPVSTHSLSDFTDGGSRLDGAEFHGMRIVAHPVVIEAIAVHDRDWPGNGATPPRLYASPKQRSPLQGCSFPTSVYPERSREERVPVDCE